MEISEIYNQYKIPPTLQLHMLRVASLGILIAESIDDTNLSIKIDKNLIVRTLLIHDMGNIIKMSFDKPSPYFTEENDNLDYWKTQREEFIKRYGNEEHDAVTSIAKELSFNSQEIRLLTQRGFSNNESTLNSSDYNLKIGSYADQRVAPDGVRTLAQRLSEAKERYKNKPNSSMNSPKTDFLIECSFKVEEQIKELVKLKNIFDHKNDLYNLIFADLTSLNCYVEKDIPELRDFDII